MDEDAWKSVEPLPEEKKVHYPFVIGDGDFAKLVGVTALPVMLLIDRDGERADSGRGCVPQKSGHPYQGRLGLSIGSILQILAVDG